MSPVRLTDKGERWLLNVIGYGGAAAISITCLAIYGFAGWVQTHN
jgi:hypothetical protein